MPPNEHFLPWNNRNRSESIPWNFFGTKIRSQPYVGQQEYTKQKNEKTGTSIKIYFTLKSAYYALPLLKYLS
jgi:hypothetical protein